MKITLGDKPVKVPGYPSLKKYNESCLIVLFSSPKTGTVIVPHEDDDFGKHCICWAEEKFTPIKEPITLKND